MKTVFSNVKNNCSENELISRTKKTGVESVELLVDHKRLLELERLNGDEELNVLKSALDKSEIKLFGFCLFTDFNMVNDIMLAKKCVNLLNKLEDCGQKVVLR